MARKHSPRLLLKRTRAGEAIESPPFPSGGGNRGSGSRGWKTAGGLGLLALLDPIAAPLGDPQQMPETAVGHWLPGLPLPLVSEAGRALLPSRPCSPQCPRGKCFSSHEVGLGKGGVAFQGCLHVAAHGPGAGGTEGETGRDGSSFRVSGRQLASSKRPLHEGPGGWAAASPARGREAARLAGGPRAARGRASAASGLHAMSAVCPRAALSLGFLSCRSPGAAGGGVDSSGSFHTGWREGSEAGLAQCLAQRPPVPGGAAAWLLCRGPRHRLGGGEGGVQPPPWAGVEHAGQRGAAGVASLHLAPLALPRGED